MWLLAAQGAALLAGMAAVVAIAHLMGTEDVGQWRFAQAITSYVMVIGDLGLTAYAMREIAQNHTRAACLGLPVIAVRVCATAALSLGVFVLLSVISLPERTRLVTLTASIGAVGLALSATYLLQGLEEMAAVSRLRAISQLAAGTAAVLAAVVTKDLIFAVVPFSMAAVLSGLVTLRWAATRRVLSAVRLTPTTAYQLARAGLPFLGAGIATQLLFNADALLLALFRGPVELGLYAAPYALASYLMVAGGVMVQAAYPRIAAHAASQAGFKALLMDLCGVMGAIALPLTLGGLLLGDEILGLLFGRSYLGEGSVFALLLSFALLGFLNMTVGQALTARGDERTALVVAVASAALNVGVNLVAIPIWGRQGAAVVVLLSECSSLVMYCAALGRLESIGPVKQYMSSLPHTVGMGVAVLSARLVGAPVVLSITVGIMTYGLLNIAVPAPGFEALIRVLRPHDSTEAPDEPLRPTP